MSIESYMLDNGMHVVLEENRTSKVVSFSAVVKVGSAFETDKQAGISHVIEHMLFKGTPSRPTGTIAAEVEAAGGEINAYTSLDQTVFYINMASRYGDKGLSILADAVQNPIFDPDELARETEVILEEIRRGNDNPAHIAGEHLFQTAYAKHTYRRPIIGYPKTVKSFTQKHLLNFHKKWYTPHNVSFVVVGDFDTKRMLMKIKKAFSGFKGSPPPNSNIAYEPTQRSLRMSSHKMNVQSTYISIGFHIPEITHPHTPILDLLAHILGGSDSSRLEQNVKEQKRLAHNIYSYAYTPRFPGIFYIGALLDDSKTEPLIRSIRDEIEKLKLNPVTASELSVAKRNIKANQVYEKETVGGEGSKLASFIAAAGSYKFEKQYYKMIDETTPEDIIDAAKQYLIPNNCSISVVSPLKSKTPSSKIAKAFSERKTPTKTKARKAHKIHPVKKVLSNGITLMIRENHNLPLISICAACVGGVRSENKKNNGISALMTRNMLKGTSKMSAMEIATNIEKTAGHIEGFNGRNIMGLRGEFMSDYADEGFLLFADILMRPSFEKKEFEKEKNIILKMIRDQEDNLSSMAFVKFLQTLFPRHPYGLRSIGCSESVRSITRDDLVKFYRQSFKAGNMVISIVGDVNAERMIEQSEQLFKDMPKGKSSFKKIKEDTPPKLPRNCTLIKKGKEQAHIVTGFQGIRYTDSDRYAMSVLNDILSGQGGRLFINLRDKMSLAYSITSMCQDGIDRGFFAVYIGTEPSKIQKALDAIKYELNSIREKKVSRREMDRSKSHLIGTFELELQRNASHANSYTSYELLGLSWKEIEQYPEKISKVTAEDITRVAKKYIKPNAYTTSIVTPTKL